MAMMEVYLENLVNCVNNDLANNYEIVSACIFIYQKNLKYYTNL